MRCPRCSELATEGAAICDNCDEILDPSFFDRYLEPESADRDAGDLTDIGPAPTAPPRQAQRPLVAKPAALGPSRARGGWEPRKEQGPVREKRPFLAPPPTGPPPTVLDEARQSAGDLTSFFRSLSVADRWAAGASLLVVVSLALPWRWTKVDDEVIGLFAAFPIFLFSGAAAVLVYVRARRAGVDLSRRLEQVQAAAAALALAYAAGFVYLTSDIRALRAAGKVTMLTISTPLFGAWVGLAFAALAAIASGAGLAARQD